MSGFSNIQFIGIDIGSQKTILVNQEADILLTDTGSVTRPTLISFLGKNRLLGEEAAPQIFGENTLASFNLLLGKSLVEIQQSALFPHRKTILSEENGIVYASVQYNGEQKQFSIHSLVAMYISKLIDRIVEVHGPNYKIGFCLPYTTSSNSLQALKDACAIANVDKNHISYYNSADCLVATYGRKLSGLRPPEKAILEGKNIILIDVGHTSTQIVVVQAYEPVKGGNEGHGPIKLGEAFSDVVGGAIFDLKMFNHLAHICETKHKTKISPGTKKSSRLLDSCERLRKLLSQLPEASTTVENLTDDGDVTFTVKRDELTTICADTLDTLRTLVLTAITTAKLEISDIHGVELLGGGVRMQVVQAVISSLFESTNVIIGAKLDDTSVALGASLLLTQKYPDFASSNSATTGLSAEVIAELNKKELAMQLIDQEVKALLSARNSLEAFVLELRGAPRRKHGQSIDVVALTKVLDECEDWIYYNCAPDSSTDTTALLEKTAQVKAATSQLCAKYLADTEAERISIEKSLEEEAKKAALEKELNGGDDDNDVDNRKLKKADRMRLVTKNKEEGNELFKGNNFRPAAARYHKALSHCAKFYDLSEDDKKEVTQAKLNLFLNLASCYLKLELWDQVVRNCDDAIEIDENSCKAYFRRALAYEGKKDLEKANADVRKSQELTSTNDPLITKASERIKKDIQKQKEKEKKMYGKAFA